MATTDYISSQGLPANIEAERSILGAILLDNLAYNQAAEHLKPEDFLLDSHRRIYSRMVDLAESSHAIDLITLAEELERQGRVRNHRRLRHISLACSTAFPIVPALSTTSRLSATRRSCEG